MKTLRTLLIAATLATTPFVAAPVAVAQVSAIDYHMATSAIMGAGNRAAKVKAIKRVPSVGIIRLDFYSFPRFSSDLPDPAEFRILARQNAAGVARLQKALQANPATRAALAKHHVDARQVAGAQISSNGSLRLYIFSRGNALR